MIKTINIKICDICKREVESLPGSLSLVYGEEDDTGCSYPEEFTYDEICINCCRKLSNIITRGLKEISE